MTLGLCAAGFKNSATLKNVDQEISPGVAGNRAHSAISDIFQYVSRRSS
jgi:hypothetical protein